MRRQTLNALGGAALAALMLGAGSCTDASMLIGARDAATLNIQPAFEGASFDAAPVLDRIRLVLTRTSTNTVVLDTIFKVSPGATEAKLVFKLKLQSDAEQLKATLYLLQSGTVLYQGTQTLVAHPGATNPNNATVTVSYVGPGATAKTVTVSPSNPSISSAGTQQFTTVVKDASGAVLTDVPVVWSVAANNATLGSINASGLFTGTGRRGSLTVTATTWSGVSGSTTLTLQPAATKVVVVSGDHQLAVPGTALPQPVIVETDGVDGPVSGVTVHFDAGTTGGSVSPASVVTNALGQATVQLTLGTASGAQQFNATSPGLTPATISATATTAPPVSIAIVSGNGQTDSTGTALAPFVVTVTDKFGNPVPGATVDWDDHLGVSNPVAGILSSSSSITDASGHASVIYTLGGLPGSYAVLATLRGTTASQRFTATALARGVAKLLVVSGDAQTGVVGTTLPQAFGVRALDVLGNSLSGVRVDFSAATTGGSVTVVNGLTDPTGLAQTQITLGPTPGAYQYTATAGKVSVTVTETAKLTGGVGLVVPGGSP
jgi:hypothetical protein